MKKTWLIASAAALIVAMAVILIILLPQGNNAPKNLRDVVGTNISLSTGISYCNDTSSDILEDEFSKVYSEAATLNVENIDESTMVATVIITAPPLRDILESCLPEDADGEFQAVFDAYMSDVYGAINACSKEDMITSTVTCTVVENNGLKIIPNNDFTEAMFPNIQQLLSEVLLEMLGATEG